MSARLTADERRDEVAAASLEFAAGGFSGTSTEAIARRAGVSQPYLFQLVGTNSWPRFATASGAPAGASRRRAGRRGRMA